MTDMDKKLIKGLFRSHSKKILFEDGDFDDIASLESHRNVFRNRGLSGMEEQ